MKNRFYNRIMGPAVLLIWAGIAWRMFMPESSNDATEVPIHTRVASYDHSKQKAIPELQLEYRDPFLDKRMNRPQRPTKTPSGISRKPSITLIKPLKKIEYPTVKYLGGVQSDGGITGLVSVNKIFQQVSLGDTVSGTRIVGLY